MTRGIERGDLMNVRLGLCQMKVTADKQANLRQAQAHIAQAAAQGAKLVLLPEMFNCPYDNACFPEYAEARGGETWQFLARMAQTYRLTLAGGSIPEREDGKIYNTCYLFSPQGQELARHRKVHLFDIDVPGGQRFRESDTLHAGDQITVAETEFGPIGLAICFDIRFSELFRVMGQRGARLILVPAAFNMTTGPAHWELSFRMRALDQQCFVAGCAPARDETASYISYGNSIVCDPWGSIAGRLDEKENVLIVDLPLNTLEDYRAQIPILSARRTDLYDTVIQTNTF